MAGAEEIKGVNFLCEACKLKGSALESEWRMFLNCPHGIHERCAGDNDGFCPTCKTDSPIRRVNRELVTQFEFGRRLDRAIGNHETREGHLSALIRQAKEKLKGLTRPIIWEIVKRRENRKMRIKQQISNEKMEKRRKEAQEKEGDPPESEMGSDGQNDEQDDTMMEEIDEHMSKEKVTSVDEAAELAPKISDAEPEDSGQGMKEEQDEEAKLENAVRCVRPKMMKELEEESVNNPLAVANEVLANIIFETVNMIDQDVSLQQQSKWYVDDNTELQTCILESVQRSSPSMHHEIMEALPDCEENIREAARINEELTTRKDEERNLTELAMRLQATLEILDHERKEEQLGVNRSPQQLQAVTETVALAKYFGVHIQTIRSEAADRVAKQTRKQYEKGRLQPNSTVEEVLEMCNMLDQNRHMNWENVNWGEVPVPESLAQLMVYLDRQDRENITLHLIVKATAARLEISDRRVNSLENNRQKMLRFIEIRQEQQEEINFCYEVENAMLIDQIRTEKIEKVECLKILEGIPEKCKEMQTMLRMDGPQDDEGERMKMSIHRDVMLAEMRVVTSKMASSLPPEEKEKRIEDWDNGIKYKMNAIWAEKEDDRRRMTQNLRGAMEEEMRNPLPPLEEVPQEPLPPIIKLSKKRFDEAYQIHLDEMGAPPAQEGVPGPKYKPLTESERRAFRETEDVRTMEEVVRFMNPGDTMFKVAIDYQKLREEARDNQEGGGDDNEEEKEEQREDTEEEKKGEEFIEKLQEIKERAQKDMHGKQKVGMVVEWPGADGEKFLAYHSPEEVDFLIGIEKRILKAEKIEDGKEGEKEEVDVEVEVEGAEAEDPSMKEKEQNPFVRMSGANLRCNKRSPRAMSLHTHSRKPTRGKKDIYPMIELESVQIVPNEARGQSQRANERGGRGGRRGPTRIDHKVIASNKPKTENKATGGIETVCIQCGEKGHIMKECAKRVCWNCGEQGHLMKECPNVGRQQPSKKDRHQDSKKDGKEGGASISAIEVVVVGAEDTEEEEEERVQLEEIASESSEASEDAIAQMGDEEVEIQNQEAQYDMQSLEEIIERRMTKNQKRKERRKRKQKYKREARKNENQDSKDTEDEIKATPGEDKNPNRDDKEKEKEMKHYPPKNRILYSMVNSMLEERLNNTYLSEESKQMVQNHKGEFFTEKYLDSMNRQTPGKGLMTMDEMLCFEFLVWHGEDWMTREDRLNGVRSEEQEKALTRKKIKSICTMMSFVIRMTPVSHNKQTDQDEGQNSETINAINTGSDDEEQEMSPGCERIVTPEMWSDGEEVPVIICAESDEEEVPPTIAEAEPHDCIKLAEGYTLNGRILDREEMRKEIMENYEVVEREFIERGEMVTIVSKNQTIKIQSRDQREEEIGMISLDDVRKSREKLTPEEKMEGWIYEENEIIQLEEMIKKGERNGAILKVHKWVQGDNLAVVKALWSPTMTIGRPKKPLPEVSPLDYIHTLQCEGIKEAIASQSVEASMSHENGETMVELKPMKRKRSPSPVDTKEDVKKFSNVNAISLDRTGDQENSGSEEEEEEPVVRLESPQNDLNDIAQRICDGLLSEEAAHKELQSTLFKPIEPIIEQISNLDLNEAQFQAKPQPEKPERRERAEILADNYKLRGEIQRKEREMKSLDNTVRKLKWELNLRLPENKWRLMREKWPKLPTGEMKAEIVGVPMKIFEQNELMVEASKSKMTTKAMVTGAIRERGETYTETVTRLGPMGLRQKRIELQESAEKELKKLIPKSYHEIREEVLRDAKAVTEHYRFRAERIANRENERFKPFDWWRQPCYGYFEETEAQIASRIRATRDGSFQPGISNFDDKMG